MGEDPAGDDSDGGQVPQGTDLGNASIATDLAGKKLTFSFVVHDQTPGGKMAPGFVYAWPFMVDGVDEARFLSAGVAGSWSGLGPIADPNGWFRLCASPDGYSCPTALTGTMGNGKVEIVLPFSRAAITAGALIEPGTGGTSTLCSTFNPTVLLFDCTGGDSGTPVGYQLPGEVKLGIAPAAVPDASVSTPAKATVTIVGGKASGSFTGSVPKPATPGDYKVVARTCFGNVDAATCVTTSTPFTVV
ncbi:MAG TPA: hypothetical protein VG602_10645 [Actinomycetota bacterium]|nr:hypothetical protein [Actinomycetota bacterium]